MNKKILYAVAACTVLFSSCGGANGKPSTADANEFLGLLRKDKHEGKYTEKGFEALSSQYNCTISSYNYFAD